MGDWFRETIVDTGRLPLFWFFVAFIATFVVARVIVRLIRTGSGGLFKNVKAGDLHVHHVVFGVVLMTIGGISGYAVPDEATGWYSFTAAIFGAGTALVLDEFALILHLRDVYWAEEGRTSVDAVFVAVAVTGLVLLGFTPLGYENIIVEPGDDPAAITIARWIVGIIIGLSLVLAVVTLLKGKIWTGLLGLFVVPLLIFGAIRLARPGSPWARWFIKPGSRRLARALRREERWRRPVIRAKIAFQEFVSGRHGAA